jgi:hypothetical protein
MKRQMFSERSKNYWETMEILDLKNIIIEKELSEAPEAHSCTPGYSGSRDQESQG